MQIDSGLGEFVPAVFPLPFNPILEAISPKPGMADLGVFVPASFPVPFNPLTNPIARELSGCGSLRSPYGCRPGLGQALATGTTATPGIMDSVSTMVAKVPGGWLTVAAVVGIGGYFLLKD